MKVLNIEFSRKDSDSKMMCIRLIDIHKIIDNVETLYIKPLINIEASYL